ncbi:hypothetical protein C8R44DRAFT_728384 [Mycena epipterygia]|nr:hypothetical protein C8R44DRAFT_728384 [Mycena epipterygia]
MKNVKSSMEAWIDSELENSARTQDILPGRLEMDSDSGKLVKKSLDFRHYLQLTSANHRQALTRMILSCHSLAVEQRRWWERGRPIVPRAWRLCHFCKTCVEDAPHAMFICNYPDLMTIREVFLRKLYADLPGLKGAPTTPLGFFRDLLPRREITPLLRKLAYDVSKIFDETPMLCINTPLGPVP